MRTAEAMIVRMQSEMIEQLRVAPETPDYEWCDETVTEEIADIIVATLKAAGWKADRDADLFITVELPKVPRLGAAPVQWSTVKAL